MTRRQRRVHAVVWLVLGPALVVLLVLAVSNRARFPVEAVTAPAGAAR